MTRQDKANAWVRRMRFVMAQATSHNITHGVNSAGANDRDHVAPLSVDNNSKQLNGNGGRTTIH